MPVIIIATLHQFHNIVAEESTTIKTDIILKSNQVLQTMLEYPCLEKKIITKAILSLSLVNIVFKIA